MKIVCPKCKKSFSHDMKFCPYCGVSLAKQETEEDIKNRNLAHIQPKIDEMKKYYDGIRHNCRLKFDIIKARPFFGIEIYFAFSFFDYKSTIDDYLVYELEKINPWPYGFEQNYTYLPFDLYLTGKVKSELKEKMESLMDELVEKFKDLYDLTSSKVCSTWIDDLYQDIDVIKEKYKQFKSEWKSSSRDDLARYQERYDIIDGFMKAYFCKGSGWISKTIRIDVKESVKDYIKNMIIPNKDKTNNLKSYFDIKDELYKIRNSIVNDIALVEDKVGNLNYLSVAIPQRLVAEIKDTDNWY